MPSFGVALLIAARFANWPTTGRCETGQVDDVDDETVASVAGTAMRLVDLSHRLGPTPSEPTPPTIRRTSHEDGAELWEWMYGIPREALPPTGGFAAEEVTASTHAGTHVDAPWHYGPTSPSGPASTIDDLPLSMFVGPLVIVDLTDLPDGSVVGVDDMQRRLATVVDGISPGDVVALRTGAEASWGDEEFWRRGSGLAAETVQWLVGMGVQLIGTDAWSLDRPYPLVGEEWLERQEPDALWPAHFAGMSTPYCHVEKLRNLGELPSAGATIIAAPIAVAEGSAGWVRAVALVPFAVD